MHTKREKKEKRVERSVRNPTSKVKSATILYPSAYRYIRGVKPSSTSEAVTFEGRPAPAHGFAVPASGPANVEL